MRKQKKWLDCWWENMPQWYLIEELLLKDNVPVLIVLCSWHNILSTVNLSPGVCSDSSALAGIVWFLL